MFQTEPVQLPNSLLREYHCCCEPETTVPSILVSAIRPPLTTSRHRRSTAGSGCRRPAGASAGTARPGTPPTARRSCPAGSCHRQVLGRPPEVLGGVAAAIPDRLGPHVAVEVDVVRRHAETGDLGEEAEVDVGGVGAGLEQHRVPLRAELVGLLLGEDGVEPALDGRGRRRRVEDVDVFGPKFGLRGSVGSTGVRTAAGARRWAAGGGLSAGAGAAGEDPELPERVAVAGAPGGAVHPDVAAGAGDVQRLGAAGAGGGRVDGRPGGAVGRGLDLEGLAVGALPLQRDLADRRSCAPRSTWIHCGSLNWLDQRVPALPSTALGAATSGVLGGGGGRGLALGGVGGAADARVGGADRCRRP